MRTLITGKPIFIRNAHSSEPIESCVSTFKSNYCAFHCGLSLTLQDQTFAENVPLAVEVSKSERAHYQALTKEKVKRSYPFFVFKVGSEKWPKHCFLEF